MSDRVREADNGSDLHEMAGAAGVMLIGRVAGRGTSLLGQVAVARLVGVEAYGLYAIGWTLMRIVGLFAPLGLDHGVVRYGSQHRWGQPARLRAFLGQSIGMALASGLVLAAALFLAAPWLEQWFGDPGLAVVIRWFAVVLPPFCVLRVATSATTVSRRMAFGVAAEELTLPISTLLLVLLFFRMGWGLPGTIAAMAAGTTLAMVLALVFVRRLFRDTLQVDVGATNEVRTLLKFSLPAALAGIFAVLMYRVDRLILGFFRPAAEVGQYHPAVQLTLIFALFASGFTVIFSPMVADLHHRGEHARLEKLFRAGTRWCVYASLPLLIVLLLIPQETLALAFGSDFGSAWPALRILALGQFAAVATAGVPFVLIMSGHQRLWNLLAIPAFVLNVVLDFALIPRLGTLGAALSTALAQVLLFGAGLVVTRKRLRLWPFEWELAKGTVAALGSCVVLLLLRTVLKPGPWATLLLVFTAFLTCYSALWALGLRPEDREILASLGRTIRR